VIVPLTVVKCGGAALARGPFVLEQFVAPGAGVCVVHGAGARISEALRAARIESHFVGGRRFTSSEALPVVRAAFQQENAELCRQVGAPAVGLMGDELGLEAERLRGFGHVGLLRPFVPTYLRDLLAHGRVPVVAPLARGPLNVNADDAAAVLAIALGAKRLVFVSDVAGVLVDGEVARELSARDISGLGAALAGGILPKLEAAVAAARQGVRAEVGATLVVA
jgi:acetylglutamate kinase